MLPAKPPSLIFSNAITNEVFDAVTEARTKNRDILLITYRGSIHESCSEFFTFIRTLRDPCSGPLSPASPASTKTQTTVSDDSISTRTNNKGDLYNSNNILFRCRARDIILSTTFIFIGRSSKKELYQFQNEMLPLNNQKEKNILTGALSFLSPLFPGTPHVPVRSATVHKKSNQRKKSVQTRRLSQKEEDHSWFRLVKDSGALICNKLGATMPPSWWGEDPSIIPTINLVSANGSLNPIWRKTDTGDNDDQNGFNAFGLGGSDRPQSGPFPCNDVLKCLIEERIKRAKRVYKWCLHAKKEFQMIEKNNRFQNTTEAHSIFPYTLPTDILSCIYEYLDHTNDILQMMLVSKSVLQITHELMIHKLRNLLKEIESILPDDSMDEDILSEIDDGDDDKVSAFTKKVRSFRSLIQNTASNNSTSGVSGGTSLQLSSFPLSFRTTSLDSIRTTSSFSSSALSEISECIYDLDRSSLSYNSNHLLGGSLTEEGNYQGAELWMGWRCHMLTSVCMANSLLNNFQILLEKRCRNNSSIRKKYDSKPDLIKLRNLKACRQKMFAML